MEHYELLADRPDAAATIAGWYFGEWGPKVPTMTYARTLAKVRSSLNRDRIPLIVLAVESGSIVGAAELKFREMDIYPEKEHWLGGVFVLPPHRGRGLGARLVAEVVRIARILGVEALHLQTERADGGLYARLGWTAVERVRYKGLDVLVMGRVLSA